MIDSRVYIGAEGELQTALHQALDFLQFTPLYKDVLLKPNLVRAYRSGSGNITDVRVVKAVIDVLIERYPLNSITIAESSSLTQDTHKAIRSSGLYKLYGYRRLVTIQDLRRTPYQTVKNGLQRSSLLANKTLINIPVLKGHPQVTLTCCVKNLKGLCHDDDKLRIHRHGLMANLPNVLEFKPELNIVDATVCRHSLELGAVSRFNRLIVGREPVLVDHVCSQMVNIDFDKIIYLTRTFQILGIIPKTNIPIPKLATWRPFVEKVSFPYADVYLGDACNYCLEASISCALSPYKPGSLMAKIYSRIGIITTIITDKLGLKKCESDGKPVIVIGRLLPGIQLPNKVIYVGRCALDNVGIKNIHINECPPDRAHLFTFM